MKTINCIAAGIVTILFLCVSCNRTDNPQNQTSTEPAHKKGALVYSTDKPCSKYYFNEQLGSDFESALQKLIASREELVALGNNLYVKQMEITNFPKEESAKAFLVQFFEKDDKDEEFPLKFLSSAHDAIDSNGNHYNVEFCDGPIDTESQKPEGSYSFEECSNCYLVLIKNYGSDYASAYEVIKPEIEDRMAKLTEANKNLVTFKSDDIIEVKNPIRVTNCEDKDITFTLIELHMFSTTENAHIFFEYFGVLDSQGNFYKVKSTHVYDSK